MLALKACPEFAPRAFVEPPPDRCPPPPQEQEMHDPAHGHLEAGAGCWRSAELQCLSVRDGTTLAARAHRDHARVWAGRDEGGQRVLLPPSPTHPTQGLEPKWLQTFTVHTVHYIALYLSLIHI